MTNTLRTFCTRFMLALALMLSAVPAFASNQVTAGTNQNSDGMTEGQVTEQSKGGKALGRGAPAFMQTKFGICRWVDATSATKSVFLPDADADGWSSFVAAAPSGVVVDQCSCPATSVPLTSSDGDTASATLQSSYSTGDGRPRSSSTYYNGTASYTFTIESAACVNDCSGNPTICNSTTEVVTRSSTCGSGGWSTGTTTHTRAPVSAPAAPACYTYNWIKTLWGTCTTGTQTRTVTCQRNDGTVVADSFCSGSGAKPAATQSCPYTGSWTTGACSKTCGGGVTAAATCSNSNCDPATRPAAGAACNTQACTVAVTATWTGQWRRAWGGNGTSTASGFSAVTGYYKDGNSNRTVMDLTLSKTAVPGTTVTVTAQYGSGYSAFGNGQLTGSFTFSGSETWYYGAPFYWAGRKGDQVSMTSTNIRLPSYDSSPILTYVRVSYTAYQ